MDVGSLQGLVYGTLHWDGEALHKHEIQDRVWADVVVSDGALSQAVRTLRRTLHEEGSGRDFIRTVSRHGYQFVCPVLEEEDAEGSIARAPSGPTAHVLTEVRRLGLETTVRVCGHVPRAEVPSGSPSA